MQAWHMYTVNSFRYFIEVSEAIMIAETTARYVPNVMTRRANRKGRLHFHAIFDGVHEQGTVIEVAYHQESYQPDVAPPHLLSSKRISI